MNALFWQELVLIIVAVVLGMAIGCFLRRYFSTKTEADVNKGASARQTSTSGSVATATSVPLVSKTDAASQQARAEALTVETNRKLAEQDNEPATKPVVNDVKEEPSVSATALETPSARDVETKIEAENDEEARIAAALAVLPADATSEQKADAVGSRPAMLEAPRGKADDLKKIKGVGKVIEGKLNDLGIYHYDQIANWTRDEVNWVTTFLSFKGRIDREEWIPQAKTLVSSDAEPRKIQEAQVEKAPETKAVKALEEAEGSTAQATSDAGAEEDDEAKIEAALAALPKDASPIEKANVAGKKPRTLKQARKAGADDLKRIKGVGKVIEGKLNDLGIYHYDQIAKWNRKEINWVSTFLSFKGRIDREDWIEQAKRLAAGEDTEFAKRVDKGEVESSKS